MNATTNTPWISRSAFEPTRAARWLAVLAVMAALVAAGWRLSIPGCLSVDEVTYLLSARSLAQGGGIEVWNGYEEFPSPELAPGWLKVVDGRLVSQYPDFFLFLALPAYRGLGLRGLFLVNVLAFAGVLALTWNLARRLYGARAALLALGLLGLSTFAFEYAVAAWPHMTSALFVVAALALVERASSGASSRSSVFAALGAGLLIGFGIGIRLDVAFVGAAFAAALSLLRPARLREVAALVLGALPALLLLALLNGRKFGVVTPFTYGPSYGIATGIGPYLPVAACGLVFYLALFVITRRSLAVGTAWRRIAIGAALVLVAGALATPALRAAIGQLARGFWEQVVDLRIRPLDTVEAATSRGPDGGIVYIGALKKALLQSCPWLVLAVLPVAEALRREELRRAALLLGAVPTALVALYSYFAWDGGLSLNQRYFVPALPMLAILGAKGILSVVARAGAGLPGLLAASAVPLGLWIWLAKIERFDDSRQSLLVLTVPLGAAGALLGALAVAALGDRLGWRSARSRAAAWLAAVAVVSGALSSWAYDLPRTLAYRRLNADLGAAAARFTGADAILFVQPTELAASALDGGRRVRLASLVKDDGRTFETLARYHAARGRPVLLAVYRPQLAQMVERGLLANWRLEPVVGKGAAEVVRMIPADAAEPAVQPP
jgi:hypothetical protein